MSMIDDDIDVNDENDDIYSNLIYEDDYVVTTHVKIRYCFTRLAGWITFLSAFCILLETMGDIRSRTGTHVTRFLFVMQIGQVLVGLSWMVGVWAAPSFVPDAWSSEQGTILTCEIFGFFMSLGSSLVLLYNSALSVLYLLMVRYNWRTQSLNKYEKIIHLIIIPTSLAVSIPPWPLDLYNFGWEICWIESFPLGCTEDNCNRGTNPLQTYLFIVLNIAMIVLSMTLSVGCMISIFLFVRRIELRNTRYSTIYCSTPGIGEGEGEQQEPPPNGLISAYFSKLSSTQRPRGSSCHQQPQPTPNPNQFIRTRKTAYQGIRYASTNLIASTPILIQIVFQIKNPYFLYVSSCSNALHGFYYLMFFLQDRTTLHTKYGRLWKHILFITTTNHNERCQSYCCFVVDYNHLSLLLFRFQMLSIALWMLLFLLPFIEIGTSTSSSSSITDTTKCRTRTATTGRSRWTTAATERK